MPKAHPADAPASIVVPVPGSFLAGIPAVPLACDAATAARLVSTGAFAVGEASDPIAFVANAALDFYAPALPDEPPAIEAATTPEV